MCPNNEWKRIDLAARILKSIALHASGSLIGHYISVKRSVFILFTLDSFDIVNRSNLNDLHVARIFRNGSDEFFKS